MAGQVANAMSSLESFMQNESELKEVFAGNEKARDKENKRTAFKKDAFLNQIVKIRLLDETGYLLDGCEWTMSRRRLTLDKLMVLIKRSPLPKTEIDFFYDQTGVPIWMEDMLLKAQPIPAFYTIVPETKRYPYDVRQDLKFEGQSIFTISQVPLKAKDEETVFDDAALREWFVCAIVEEDPHSKPLFAKIQPVKDIIAEIDKKIKGISKMKFFDENGKELDDDKSELEREVLYNAFGEDRLVAEKRLKKFVNNYDAHVAWRKTIGLKFEQLEVDENTGTAMLQVRLYGHEDADDMEDLLIAKDNWAGIRVACGNDKVSPKIPPWAGRGAVPDGSNPLLADYTLLQVNVAGARFKRLPHGVGTYKRLNRSSSNIADEKFGIYYGNFETGKKVGTAIEIDDVSVFSGRFTSGYRKGKGRMDLADGTSIICHFGTTTQVENKISIQFDNPYIGGEPNDEKAEVMFGDGAIYRGNMVNGRIHGKGEYQSALGDVTLGFFHNGTLHGPDGYRKNASGEEFWGNWDMGELDGYGKYKNERGDSYEGYFDHDLRMGRGVATYAKLGRYRGYFVNNCRNGKGELEYGLRPKPKKKKVKDIPESTLAPPLKTAEESKSTKEPSETTGPPPSPFINLYMGYFLSNNVTNGGITMPQETQVPSVVSRRDKRRLQPIQFVLDRDAQNCKKLQRLVEKMQDMEGYIRKEMTEKKMKVFRQQRHFTKKTMYNVDQYGDFPKADLQARAIIRAQRLNRMDESVLKPKNARVPHLQLISTRPQEHLAPVVDNIHPEHVRPQDKVTINFVRATASDFEEVLERQRFLKYDAIWQRAETAFSMRKRAEKSGGDMNA